MDDQKKLRIADSVKFLNDAISACQKKGNSMRWDSIDRQKRPDAYYGPESHFTQAVDGWVADPNFRDGLSAASLLSFAPPLHDKLSAQTVDRDLLSKIAAYKLAGASESPEALETLRCAFNTDTDKSASNVLTHEDGWVDAAIQGTGFAKKPATIGDWRCLTFAFADVENTGKHYVEKTPIFLANAKGKKGYVLYLVAERLPGPAIVTPHWWRLGAVRLTDDLVQEFHRGFQTVLSGRSDEKRFQIRWWLENPGKAWPTSIADTITDENGKEKRANPSVNAAAACVALALGDEDVRADQCPILDRFVGVSASLVESPASSGIAILDWSVGDVGHVEQKCSDAHDAKLDTFVLEADCKSDNANVLREKKGDHEISILGRKTLGDVYETLKVSNSDFVEAKQRSFVSRDEMSPAQWFDRHVCTATEQTFVDLSNKSKEE